MLIASTANPFKFSASVLSAVGNGQVESSDEFGRYRSFPVLQASRCRRSLQALQQKKQRFTKVCERDEMKNVVYEMLGIESLIDEEAENKAAAKILQQPSRASCLFFYRMPPSGS